MVSTIRSGLKSQSSCELGMQDKADKSIGALSANGRADRQVATLRTKVKLQLDSVASRLVSSRSPLGKLLVVVVVSIILLRSSG